MALPFIVFEVEHYDIVNGRAYCLRCERYVPTVGPFSGGLDPHIEDHLIAWHLLCEVRRKLESLNEGRQQLGVREDI